MSLPSGWIDSIFARLSVRYGAAWARMYEGLDVSAVKADWAQELACYASDPEPIKYALEHLPTDWPPTVGQFKALCINKPLPEVKRLSPPEAKKESIERAKQLGIKTEAKRGTSWAEALRKRELACERLTSAQRAMWRAALGQGAEPEITDDEKRARIDAQQRSSDEVQRYASEKGIAL